MNDERDLIFVLVKARYIGCEVFGWNHNAVFLGCAKFMSPLSNFSICTCFHFQTDFQVF